MWTPDAIEHHIGAALPGVAPKCVWGETSFFYNPGAALPHGVYFSTLKTQDGANDAASRLDRDGVFRLSIGLGRIGYTPLFGAPPERPAKGETVRTPFDPTERDLLMPHPIYAWMGWVQILSPSLERRADLLPLIDAAHARAKAAFDAKVGAKADTRQPRV